MRYNGDEVDDEVVSNRNVALTGGADAVGVTIESGTPPVDPTGEDAEGRAGPGMTIGV